MTAPAYLYRTTVRHNRVGRVKHRLQYRVYSLLVDIDRLDDPALPSWFSHNRFNLFAIRDADHGPKDGSNLRAWITNAIRQAGGRFEVGTVRLLCFPRVFGHTFNPLSVWYIADSSGTARATLYEVRNTFGEWHNYLFWSEQALTPKHSTEKQFYVSPFLDMQGGYRFFGPHPSAAPARDEKLTLSINRSDADGPVLNAQQSGTAKPLTNREIVLVLLTRPLMTLKVVGGIHFEALQLLFKGAKFHHRPRKPVTDLTFVQVTN